MFQRLSGLKRLLRQIKNKVKEYWHEFKDVVLESQPSLKTLGYTMNILYIPPNSNYDPGSEGFIICVLRGNVIGEGYLVGIGESQEFKGDILLGSGESGCLAFVCRDEGKDKEYDLSHPPSLGEMEVKWSAYSENMYRTIPQIHVDGYRINLWYLGPGKCGGIHNHSNEPVPFVEFHTQLGGTGWMVKYEDREGKKELERIEMARGYTHDLFCIVEDKKVIYPWHEYIAGEKGSLFIVFEDTRI